MGNTTKDVKKTDWVKAIRTQFKKIIWPSREDVARESAVVLAATVFLGVVIAILDRVLLLLVDLIISL